MVSKFSEANSGGVKLTIRVEGLLSDRPPFWMTCNTSQIYSDESHVVYFNSTRELFNRWK